MVEIGFPEAHYDPARELCGYAALEVFQRLKCATGWPRSALLWCGAAEGRSAEPVRGCSALVWERVVLVSDEPAPALLAQADGQA